MTHDEVVDVSPLANAFGPIGQPRPNKERQSINRLLHDAAVRRSSSSFAPDLHPFDPPAHPFIR
jgi:hypothetical protein